MTSLFAIVFEDRQTAEAALEDLRGLQKGAVLAIHDAVIVTRGADGGVKLDQSVNIAAMGALSGAFWGSLIGLIFLSPLVGAAVGAAAGGLSGYFTDYGVDDGFASQMGNRLKPGRVALFVLASNVTPEKIAEALEPRRGELFYSSFSPEVERRFRQGIEGAAGDVAGPRTDADLDAALEDTFPGSDPINFAGGVSGTARVDVSTPPVDPSAAAGTKAGLGVDEALAEEAARRAVPAPARTAGA